ncbi:Ribonucleoside-diphosphate reductase NrdZ [compost metagenome]
MSKNTEPVQQYSGILIDYSRDNDIPEQGLSMLTRNGFYKKDHETSPQEGFARAATCYSFGDYEFAQRIYDYASKGWYTNASPVLSNAQDITWPTFSKDQFEEAGDWLEDNVSADGMPISCFLVKIPDTKEGLVDASSESKWLSMMGGGIGVWASNRGPDEKSTGVMAHMSGYDADTLAYKQKESRRGSIAAYLDIDHPEIMQFISMRDPVGGDQNKKCFNLNNAVTITDKFMHSVIKGEDYELVDPKHGPTGRYMNAREVWEKILQMRFETGEPYIMWRDTVNRKIPKWIKNPHYFVGQSNLCSEITLWTSEKRTAVCCLSSLNLEKYEEWKNTTIVADLVRYLDNVLEYFIRLAPQELKKAVYSASKERAIGLGTLGWSSYLQSKLIPFESGGFNSAIHHTHQIYSDIKSKAVESSKQLAKERGESPDCEGSGMRNSHLLAIAPNASSSSMVGASPSIEPWKDNCFVADGRAGAFLIKNKYLEKLLEDKGVNSPEVWKSIETNNGSVQHLDCLDEHEKSVFKTSKEIDPMWIIEQAGARTPYICQSTSLNIFVTKDTTKEEMSDIHMKAWELGVPTMYYCRAEGSVKANVGTGTDKPLNAVSVRKKIEYNECRSCEG